MSLRIRAALPIAGTFAALALIEYLYFPARSHETQLRALRAKAVAIAELAASGAAAPLEFDDRTMLDEQARGAARDADLVYIAVFDAHGALVHRMSRVAVDIAALPHDARATTTRAWEGYLHVMTPVPQSSGPSGTLVAGFSMTQVDAARSESETVATLIAIAIFALGAAVALQNAVAMRRLQLLADENRDARQRAEAASRAKSEFLANMSHEVRTPLNGVIGLAQSLLRAELPPKHHASAEIIARSGKHLLAIVNDVLDFSKIEAGKLELQPMPFDPRELILRVVESGAAHASAKGLMVSAENVDALPGSLRGDALRIEQVLMNLIHNAVKFTERGGVTVGADCTALEGGRVLLQLRVVDTGIGIPADKQASLFRAFEQADTSITRAYGGTGLGLAICKQLADLMGGEIELESAPGQGSTFRLTLTLELTEQDAPAEALARSRSIMTPGASAVRVLAAEDNVINQEVLRDLAEHFGWSIDLVDNGSEAVAALRGDHNYQAVLMDCQMPVMDGYTAARAIRELEQRSGASRIPIVAVTAHALSGERDKAIAAGMDGFVTKPIDDRELREAVEALLAPRPEPAARSRA